MNTVSAHIVKKNVKTKQKTVVFKKYHVNLTGVLGDGGVGGGPEILKYLSFGTRFL